jgi:hypothetical protein
LRHGSRASDRAFGSSSAVFLELLVSTRSCAPANTDSE